MSKDSNVIFFGNERLATGLASTELPIVRGLVEAGYTIQAIVLNQDPNRREKQNEMLDFARRQEIAVISGSPSEVLAELKNYSAEVGVLAAYGRIVPQSIIDHFAHGIVNIHPSLLPKYRGSTPIEQTILNGDAEAGVSLMQLAKTMDDGPVFDQSTLKLSGAESKQELADALGRLGAEMLIKALPAILDQELQPKTQDNNATYTKQIQKSDGQIDWQKSAEELEREVRAYLGWPGSYTQINGRDVIITEAQVLSGQGETGQPFVHEKQLAVYTSQDSLLITKLKPAGKAEMPSQAFLAGNPLS